MLDDLYKNLGVIGQLGVFAPLNEDELNMVIKLKDLQDGHKNRLAYLRRPMRNTNISYTERCARMASIDRAIAAAVFALETIEDKAEEITRTAWARMKASLKRR